VCQSAGVQTLGDVAVAASRRASEIEAARRLPADLVEALAVTGVFKLWVPAVYGGAQAHLCDGLDAIEEVAYHDGSTGWCVMIATTTGLCAGFLPPAHATAIYGPSDVITGGFAMPAGTATPSAGGLRVDGRWSWGSGTDHCTSICGGVRLVDSDPPRTPVVFFDIADVELIDTWHVAGLKGTASGDYAVRGAFVPEGRWVEFGGEPVVDDPLYRVSFLGALAIGVAAVVVGLGRRAIDELLGMAAKIPAGSSRSLAERPVVQAQLATADAAVRSARAFLHAAAEECWAAATAGHPVTGELRRLMRLAATDAVMRCAGAVDVCYHAAGGSAVFETHPLQRVFRDTHVATQHGMVAARTLETLGRMQFGLPTDTRQL
jgi:alkylation response protein AidB-like acyl-CoA dehydrogenase